MSRRSRLAAGLVALAAVAFAPSAEANPLDVFGFGSRETAMGNTGVASSEGPAANHYNPASLAAAKGIALSVGYFRADHFLQMNGQDNDVDPVKGVNAALVLPGHLGRVAMAFGAFIHLPDDRLSRVRALRQEQPRWELYDNRNQRLAFGVNVAVAPIPELEFGIGYSFLASTDGRIAVTGQADIFAPETSRLRHEVDADLAAVRYPQLGARVHLSKHATLGLVYRGEFQLALDLKANVNGDLSRITTARYDLATRSTNNFLPRQVSLGGAWSFANDRVKTSFDATWVQWSAYVLPVAFLEASLDIPPPKGGFPGGLTAPETPAPTRIVPVHFADRIVPHLGVEWQAVRDRAWELFLRGGYEMQKSPIAAQSGAVNYVDRDRHTVSGGVGVLFPEPATWLGGDVAFDLHAQRMFLVANTTTKTNPADLVGDFNAGGFIWNLGATLTVSFHDPKKTAGAK